MESKGNTLVSPFVREGITSEEESNNLKILELLPIAIYICDKNGLINFHNTASLNLFGTIPDKQEKLWLDNWKIFDSNGLPLNLENTPMFIAIREKKTIERNEIIIERIDGRRINVQCNVKINFDSEGNIKQVINLFTDITNNVPEASLSEDLKNKSEEALDLHKSEERYHKMIDEVKDYAILLLDKDGYILNWNQGAKKIKGYSEQEILGKNFRLFYRPEDQKTKLPEKLIAEAVEKGRATHEGWRVRNDGTTFWGSVVITALHGNDNEIIGFSKVTRDLTERKRAEDQLHYYAQSIESQNKQLEQFAYIASHDLQEPLRKIRIFASILENNIENPELVKTNVNKINIAATRMSTLITDILTYSQLSQLNDLFKEIDLNTLLSNVKEDFDLIIEEKKAVIKSDVLPTIKGVPMQLHQLFSNLISNAMKFSKENPVITISYKMIFNEKVKECPDLPYENSFHKISFTDNGIGFEQQYADQAFKLFHRLHNKTSGTGIGLALCKKIVENHRGYIGVHSEPSKGTTFTILLPV